MIECIRVIDTETTGLESTDEVVEIAAVDVRSDVPVRPFGSELVKPERPIPIPATAVHHITDAMVVDARPWGEVWPDFLQAPEISAFAAHKASFDGQWVTDHRRGGKPIICTWKCAMRQWPDAPGFSNQILRYFLGIVLPDVGPVHRAAGDALVTAHILVALLREQGAETLIAWSADPAVYPTCNLKAHKGKKWADVPIDYLDWMTSGAGSAKDMEADLVWNAQHEKDRRSAEAAALRIREREAHVGLASFAIGMTLTVPDLEAWWRSYGEERVRLGIIPGTDEYASLAGACAARKAAIEPVPA